MHPGVKVGLLVGTLAAAVGAVLWFVGSTEDEGGTPLPPPTAPNARPTKAPAPRHAKPKVEKADDELEDGKPAVRTSTNFTLMGTVVDADEKPVADATVRALRADGVSVEGKSGADGTFALSCGPRPRVGTVSIGVTATLGPSRAGFLTYELLDDAADSDDCGAVTLEPSLPVIARVMDASGPVAGATVSFGSFFGTVFATATTDAKGVARLPASPAADAWLFAYAKGKGRARGEIPEKRDPNVPLVLTLTARTLRVEVVRTPPVEPLAGETIGARIVTDVEGQRLFSDFVPPLEIAPTSADGTTRIEDVALEDAVEVRCYAPSRPGEPWRAARRPSNPVIADGRATDARIEIPAGRTVRWQIAVEGAEPPAPGSLVRIKPALNGVLPPGPSHLKVENGDLVGSGFAAGPITGVAETDDGAVATLRVESNSERGPDAVFRRPRRVDVTLADEDGRPIAGASITLKMDDDRARPVGDAVETDADGRAAIVGLDPAAGRVQVFESSGKPADVRKIGVVDVTRGDARLDAKLPRVRSLTVRVSTDGERKMPPGLKALVNNTWTDDVERDEPAAELRLSARPLAPDRSLYVVLRADGYRDVTIRAGAASDVVEAAFDKGVVVLAEIRGVPAGWNPQTWIELWDEAQKGWRGMAQVPFPRLNAPSASHRAERMAPGRYRLREYATDMTSRSIDLALGDAPGELLLDVSTVGFVTGRVLDAEDKPVMGASIVVEEPTTDGTVPKYTRGIPAKAMSKADGAFSVIVRGDRPSRVRAVHPLMKRDAERDFADVQGAKDVGALHLVPGPVLEFSVRATMENGVWVQRAPSVQLFRDAAAGEPACVLALDYPSFTQTKRRYGGFDPGRYTLWIDSGVGAPLILPDVELKDGANDLGELRPPRGSSVVVKVAGASEAAPRFVRVVVSRLDAPTYSRAAMSKDAEIVAGGLGPGRFEVTIQPQGMRAEDAVKRTVDLDGERDVVVEYAPK